MMVIMIMVAVAVAVAVEEGETKKSMRHTMVKYWKVPATMRKWARIGIREN